MAATTKLLHLRPLNRATTTSPTSILLFSSSSNTPDPMKTHPKPTPHLHHSHHHPHPHHRNPSPQSLPTSATSKLNLNNSSKEILIHNPLALHIVFLPPPLLEQETWKKSAHVSLSSDTTLPSLLHHPLVRHPNRLSTFHYTNFTSEMSRPEAKNLPQPVQNPLGSKVMIPSERNYFLGRAKTTRVGQMNDPMAISKFKETLRLKPGDRSERDSPLVIGGSDNLPLAIFGKEIREKEGASANAAMKTEFMRIYEPEKLGEMLRSLCPEKKGKDWFSLEELNERLTKLREIEKKEGDSATGFDLGNNPTNGI